MKIFILKMSTFHLLVFFDYGDGLELKMIPPLVEQLDAKDINF